MHMRLIMQLQVIVEEQAKPYASMDAKIRNLKDMASTLAFCQENHIESREELESLLASTHEDYTIKKKHTPSLRMSLRKPRIFSGTQSSVTPIRRYTSSS